MNVLLSAYECDPKRGSEYGRSWSWVMEYLSQGFTVHCLTSIRGESSIRGSLKEKSLPGVYFHFVHVNNLLEEKYGSGTFWTYGHYLLWLQKAYRVARDLNREVDFTFAHHVSWGSLQLGTFLWRMNIPYVYGPLGGGQLAPAELKSFFLEGWSLEVKRKLISDVLLRLNFNTRMGISKAASVLVVNEETKDLAIKLGAAHTRMVVDTNIKEEDISTQDLAPRKNTKLKLIWAARLLYRKGLPLVLKAMAKLNPDLPITLSVYGDGPFGKDLPAFINELQIGHKVQWHGQVPKEILNQAYLTHDVFVFCTLRESLGVQFFEAMAHGLPVIALNIHGAKTAIPDEAGIKLPLKQADELVQDLAHAIEKLYHEEDLRLSMAKAARQHVKDLLHTNKVETVLSVLHHETRI